MADIAITVANVVKGAGATVVEGVAGATITAGQTIYLDTANGNVVKPADGNATQLTAACQGIALHAALTNQPIAYVTAGPLTCGGTLTAGSFYYVSGNAGGICPVGDVVAGFFPCQLGYASTTTVLQVNLIATGVAI